jgi:hypothetical protein
MMTAETSHAVTIEECRTEMAALMNAVIVAQCAMEDYRFALADEESFAREVQSIDARLTTLKRALRAHSQDARRLYGEEA